MEGFFFFAEVLHKNKQQTVLEVWTHERKSMYVSNLWSKCDALLLAYWMVLHQVNLIFKNQPSNLGFESYDDSKGPAREAQDAFFTEDNPPSPGTRSQWGPESMMFRRPGNHSSAPGLRVAWAYSSVSGHRQRNTLDKGLVRYFSLSVIIFNMEEPLFVSSAEAFVCSFEASGSVVQLKCSKTLQYFSFFLDLYRKLVLKEQKKVMAISYKWPLTLLLSVHLLWCQGTVAIWNSMHPNSTKWSKTLQYLSS